MALSKAPYKGTRDFFPKDKRILDYLFSKMRLTSESFGYEAYDGPMLEEVELYKAKSGEELINEQIYSFTDRGERFVAIRPEMTPTVARMVAQIHREESKPIRWYSIPNLYRYEKPQKGRLREHWQFNCDIFGAPGRTGEVEILQVVIGLLQNYGADASQFELLLNDRMIVDTVFTKLMGVTSEQAYRLYKIVDKSKKVNFEAVEKMTNETGISEGAKAIFYQYLKLKTFDDVFTFLEKNNHSDIAKSFKSFIDGLFDAGLKEFIVYDPSIVRGLDYYTGVVFEIFDKHPDNRRAICGGGAYANLLQIFNEQPLAGVGFGLGDVTLRDFLETHKLLPNLDLPVNDYFVAFLDDESRSHAFKIATALRSNGNKVISALEPLKVNKIFPIAEKKGAKFVILIGAKELSEGKFIVKNLKERSQTEVQISDLENWATNLK